MPVLRMDIRQWERWHAGLAEKTLAAAQVGMMSAAMRTVAALQDRTRNAIPASPGGLAGAVDTGDLLRSWRIGEDGDGALLVYTDRPHGPVVDGGRTAGRRMPPKAVIEAWLVRRAGMSPAEAKRAAYPVARAIGRRGLNARQIATASDFQDQIADWAAEEIAREVGNILGEPP